MISNPREQLNKLLDPKFYLENFTKIKGKTPGLIPFVLNDAQKDLFNSLRVNPRVMILKARQIGFCVDKNTKVLSNKLEWIRAEDIAIGQSIVSVDEFPLKIGRGSSRKMRTGIVEKKWIVHEDAIQLMTDDGRELILTPGHRMMSQKKGGDSIIWKKVSDMKIGDVLRYVVKPWKETSSEDAWFGGILDGEGCLRFKNHTGAEVCATQRLGALFDDMKQYAVSTGLNFKLEHDNRPTVEGGKFGNNPCAKIVFNRMDEVFRIIGQTRPKRFVGQHWWEGKDLPGKRSGIGWSKIVSIKYLGKREMIDLQTSEKTFIAEGYVSHNSTAVTGYLYHKTITNPGTNTALIGYNSDLTAELLDKVKTIYRTTPKSIQPTIQYNSKYEISFPAIDSKILVLPSSENVGRGYTLHNVLCVSGNTRVIMKNFSTRKVSEISPGDEIINGNGGFSVVSKAIKSQNNKKLLRIISYGSDDLVVTEDHKIMTREKFTGRPIWKKAGELTKNDYLAYPYFQNRNKPVPWVNQGGGYWLRGKNYYWSRISSVQEAPNEEYVYDLSLSGDPHSFLTHAGVVSNCTELAFWDKAEEKMLAIENAVPQNGSIVIESTPNAIGNLYHRMWMADNGYDKKKYGWWWHYTEAEIEIIRKRINNPMRFAQEYELEFLSTGRPVFPTDLVKKCRKNILHVGDKVHDENKTEYTVTKDEDGFVMYFPPRPGRIYAVGADVA
ncbi:MAG: hypothetical protein WC910_06000, partial [Bacteroidales bacterium]